MGNYNPHVPQILGQEWVPIRDEDLQYNPFANSFERGHAFTLPTEQQVSQARFYCHQLPQANVRNRLPTVSVYPKGQEDRSGPVRSVIIPCSAGGVTGNSGVVFFQPYFTQTASMAEAMYSAADAFNYLHMNSTPPPPQPTTRVSFFFATSDFSELLGDKRILGVNFLLEYKIFTATLTEGPNWGTQVWVSNNTLSNFPENGTPGIYQFPTIFTVADPIHISILNRIRLGDANPSLNVTTNFVASYSPFIQQWTYGELLRFEESDPNRIFMYLVQPSASSDVLASGPSAHIGYAGLEVFYCNETRVAFGTTRKNGPAVGATFSEVSAQKYVKGANYVLLRDPTGNLDPVLPAGDYTVTLSESNSGDALLSLENPQGIPLLNESRQLYEIPTHPGVQVNLPFPLNEEIIGTQLTAESTDLLPQISLHTTGGVSLNPVHVYGRQSAGQVFLDIDVEQIIDDGVIDTPTEWPWVRYYARRFGETGAALLLSSPDLTEVGNSVEITPGDFDLLDEIVDGWKEVTLRFPNPPIMGGGTQPTWRWTALGEAAGNRWEILGATAPAASGTPYFQAAGLTFPKVDSTQVLDGSTYGQPTDGATVLETWLPHYGPYVVFSSDPDPSSDAVLIFGQDMPQVTGFTVTQMSQPVSGIGQNCGLDPCGIPTAIAYNQLSWTGAPATLEDSFSRIVASGWGDNPDYPNSVWSGDTASMFVDGTSGFITTVVPDSSLATNNIEGERNQELYFEFSWPQIIPDSGTSNIITRCIAWMRRSGAGLGFNGYRFILDFEGDGTGGMTITKFLGGGPSTLVGTSDDVPELSWNPTIGSSFWKFRARVTDFNIGSASPYTDVRMKAWRASDQEPDHWQLIMFDSAPLSGTGGTIAIGTQSGISSGTDIISPAVVDMGVDNIQFSGINPSFYEIQRRDELTDWHTIMRTEDPFVVSFKDYEARIGIETEYRIRRLSVYEFPGPWSETVTITTPSPGLSGSCLSDAHVLVFSSNERQDGSCNLAYSMAWESRVTEDFAFAESGFVQLQPMYNKNFFTAFHSTERGGESFQRDLLVQAAAIAPETLGDFTSLRDMAWEDIPYVCVRDEDGNRWFATVGVPSGSVTNRRKLYIAQVQVAEVTDTPSPADPADPLVAGRGSSDENADIVCDVIMVSDLYSRAVSGGWGTADIGGAYSDPTGASVAVYSVDGSSGLITLDSINDDGTQLLATLDLVQCEITYNLDYTSAPVTGGTLTSIAYFRADPALATFGKVEFDIDLATNTVTRISLSTDSGLVQSVVVSKPHTDGVPYSIKIRSTTSQSVKIWSSNTLEPASFDLSVTNPVFAGMQGAVGLAGQLTGSATSFALEYDNLLVTSCEPDAQPGDFICEDEVAEDSFARVEASGWGSADLGGAWTDGGL
jgi:hypothetical protein